MTYRTFKDRVRARGWTIRQLRSDDAPPDAELLAFMDEVGGAYERHVLRLQAELEKSGAAGK